MRRIAIALVVSWLVAGCGSTAGTPPLAPASAPMSAPSRPAASSAPTISEGAAAPSVLTTVAPTQDPLALADLPKTVAGVSLQLQVMANPESGLNDATPEVEIARRLGLTKSDIYVVVFAGDWPVAGAPAKTVDIGVWGFRGAHPDALLHAWMTVAPFCPGCAYRIATSGAKATAEFTQKDVGGFYEWDYARGDLLYDVRAKSLAIAEEVVAALP